MEFVSIFLIILVILALWIIILTVLLLQTRSHYHALTAGISQKDLTSALNQVLKRLEHNQKDIEEVSTRLSKEIDRGKSNFKRLGFKRYNPFTDTGGDQSFVLCLLDETNSGFVVSSLHSRENTRIYAKRIEAGTSTDQILSREEQEVITSAIK